MPLMSDSHKNVIILFYFFKTKSIINTLPVYDVHKCFTIIENYLYTEKAKCFKNYLYTEKGKCLKFIITKILSGNCLLYLKIACFCFSSIW